MFQDHAYCISPVGRLVSGRHYRGPAQRTLRRDQLVLAFSEVTRGRVLVPDETARTLVLSYTGLVAILIFQAVIVIGALWFMVVEICLLLLGQHLELLQDVSLLMRWRLLLGPRCTCRNLRLRPSIVRTLPVLVDLESADLLLSEEVGAARLVRELYLLLFAHAGLVAQGALGTVVVGEELLVLGSHDLALLRLLALVLDQVQVAQFHAAGLILDLVVHQLVVASIREKGILFQQVLPVAATHLVLPLFWRNGVGHQRDLNLVIGGVIGC